MGGNLGAESGIGLANVLLSPEVANAVGSGAFDIGKIEGGHFGHVAPVEEPDCGRTVRHFLFDDLDPLGVLCFQTSPHVSERVLVDSEHLTILKETKCELVAGLGKIAAEQEGRGEQAPERDVRVSLVGGQAARVRFAPANGADDQHIRIVPMSGTDVGPPSVHAESNRGDHGPVVLDIGRQQIAGVGDCPGHRRVVAHREGAGTGVGRDKRVLLLMVSPPVPRTLSLPTL